MKTVILILILPFFLKGQLVKYQENYKVGYKDKNGAIVITPQYEAGSDFKDGFAIIIIQGKRGYIDSNGTIVILPQYQDASLFFNGLAAVKYNNLYGFIDTKGTWVIKNQFQNAFDFSEGLARVQTNELWGMINPKGDWVILPKYNYLENCTFQRILAKVDSLYGFLNPKGEWAIKPKYTEAHSFMKNTRAIVSDGMQLIYIDTKGHTIPETVPMRVPRIIRKYRERLAEENKLKSKGEKDEKD